MDTTGRDGQWKTALELLMAGRLEDALACYEKLARQHPAEYDLWCTHGSLLLALDRPHAAIDSYDRAIAADAERAGAWSGMAEAFARLDQGDEALACARRALTLARAQESAAGSLGAAGETLAAPRAARAPEGA